MAAKKKPPAKPRHETLPATQKARKAPPLNRELFEQVILRIVAGDHLYKACRAVGADKTVFYQWLWEDDAGNPAYAGVANAYTRACKARTDAMHEANFLIAEMAAKSTYKDQNGAVRIDPGAVQAARLIIDTHKWSMARMNAMKYAGRDLEDDGGVLKVVIENSPDA